MTRAPLFSSARLSSARLSFTQLCRTQWPLLVCLPIASVVAAGPAWSYWQPPAAATVTLAGARVRMPGRVSAEWTAAGARLTWRATDPASGSVDPDGYLVERSRAANSDWQRLAGSPICGGDPRTCTLLDPIADETRSYRYRVLSTLHRWQSAPRATEMDQNPSPAATLGGSPSASTTAPSLVTPGPQPSSGQPTLTPAPAGTSTIAPTTAATATQSIAPTTGT
jgi:hypothetical protein